MKVQPKSRDDLSARLVRGLSYLYSLPVQAIYAVLQALDKKHCTQLACSFDEVTDDAPDKGLFSTRRGHKVIAASWAATGLLAAGTIKTAEVVGGFAQGGSRNQTISAER